MAERKTLTFTPEQEQGLKESIADASQWISVEKAIELIKSRLSTTTGHARKLLADARASKEVEYLNDDGIIKDPRFDYAYRKDDLEGWLDRHYPQTTAQPTMQPETKKTSHRHAGDAELIEEGLQMHKAGMSKLQAATKLAAKAKGGSLDQRIERLRKLI
jgi:hypothetical protein